MPDLADRFDRQAIACGSLGSPMYSFLLSRAADDIRDGGATAALVGPFAALPRGAAVSLRMMAGVHAAVLQGIAPELAPFYPSVGGTVADNERLWRAFQAVLVAQPDFITQWLAKVPQTNEVGRAVPLRGSLLCAVAALGVRPLRLFELGTSAGLNLLVDLLPIPADALPTLASTGQIGNRQIGNLQIGNLQVVERLGVDPNPIDATSELGRLQLTAYVWADQLDRLERLTQAIQLASKLSPPVYRGTAGEFTSRLHLGNDTLTVLWHSVMWQYLDGAEQLSVQHNLDRLASEASTRAPFAHISFEPDSASMASRTAATDTIPQVSFEVRLRLWPHNLSLLMGHAPAHGVPVRWNEEVIRQYAAN